jgi:hypothetical protein
MSQKPLSSYAVVLKTAIDSMQASRYKAAVRSFEAVSADPEFAGKHPSGWALASVHICIAWGLSMWDDFDKAEYIQVQNCLELAYSAVGALLPVCHFLLAKCAMIAHDYGKATEECNSLANILDNGCMFKEILYPESDEVVPVSTRPYLLKALKELQSDLRFQRRADLVCRGNGCETPNIYFDFDFHGYVKMECYEKCVICYHLDCFKPLQRAIGLKDLHELKSTYVHCCTPSCGSRVYRVAFFGPGCSSKKSVVCGLPKPEWVEPKRASKMGFGGTSNAEPPPAGLAAPIKFKAKLRGFVKPEILVVVPSREPSQGEPMSEKPSGEPDLQPGPSALPKPEWVEPKPEIPVVVPSREPVQGEPMEKPSGEPDLQPGPSALPKPNRVAGPSGEPGDSRDVSRPVQDPVEPSFQADRQPRPSSEPRGVDCCCC